MHFLTEISNFPRGLRPSTPPCSLAALARAHPKGAPPQPKTAWPLRGKTWRLVATSISRQLEWLGKCTMLDLTVARHNLIAGLNFFGSHCFMGRMLSTWDVFFSAVARAKACRTQNVRRARLRHGAKGWSTKGTTRPALGHSCPTTTEIY